MALHISLFDKPQFNIRLATEDTYTKLNSAPITALSYTDTGLSAAPVGATYYYVLSAVDSSNDESVTSAPVALTIAGEGDGEGGDDDGDGDGDVVTNGHGRRNGCFVETTASYRALDLLMPAGVIVLLCCLIWISRHRRREKKRPPGGLEERRFAP